MKEFQFGIEEPTKELAIKKLRDKIGYDSFKWRFEAKQLPKDIWKYPVIKLSREEFENLLNKKKEENKNETNTK